MKEMFAQFTEHLGREIPDSNPFPASFLISALLFLY